MSVLENKFNYLLVVFVALFLISPLEEKWGLGFPIGALVFLVAVILTLKSVTVKPILFWGQVGLSVVAFGLTALSEKDLLHDRFGMLASGIYATFIAGATAVLLKRLVTEKHIKVDTVKGGVCVYFLIGFLWAMLYMMLYIWHPESFPGGTGESLTYHDFHYYSFTVLTTLGFGDIVSTDPLTRNLSTLEAIVGQIFLAVFVARLMGLYLAQEQNRS